MIWVDDLKMNTDEYVYIYPDLRAQGMITRSRNGSNGYNFWMDINVPPDGKDDQALRTAYKSFTLDIQNQDMADFNAFKNLMTGGIGQAPFYCNGTCMGPDLNDYAASIYANYLHDAMYLYALAVNRTMEQLGGGPDLRNYIRNGTFFANMTRGQFEGRTGLVRIGAFGIRQPLFWVTGLNVQGVPTVWLNISDENSGISVTRNYTDEAVVWANRAKGLRPLDNPICGYSGVDCPVSIALYLIIGGGLVLMFTAIALAGISTAVREKFREQERLERECLISSMMELSKFDLNGQANEGRSQRSFYSTTASSGETSVTVISSSDAARLIETEHHAFFKMARDNNEELVYAEKYPFRVKLNKENMIRLRMLRQFDHDNVNRFLGISVDGPGIMALWKYCHRGSLQDVITKESYISDAFVAFTLMRDITNVCGYAGGCKP